MKKSIYYCDICGKEFTNNPQNYMCRIRLKELPLFAAAVLQENEMDVCFDCKRELYKLLKLEFEVQDNG